MNVGDLIWFNSAGSKQTAIVLDFGTMSLGNRDPRDPSYEMALLHWSGGGKGVLPPMYDAGGRRMYGDRFGSATPAFGSANAGSVGYCRTITRSGHRVFKVLARAEGGE